MILSTFIDKLKTQLPNATWRLSSGQVPTVVFPAVSQDFGDIKVAEEHGELTVYFGRFTHSHFSSYDSDLTEPEQADEIASSAISCLKVVFADQLVFYGSHSGGGGFRQRGSEGDLSPTYVWSGQNA